MSVTAWSLRRTSNPDALPVSLADAKKHLRLSQSDTSQDDALTLLLYAAAERLERDVNRQFISATYQQTSCEFGDHVLLMVRPVTAVSSVSYLDEDGATVTMDSSDYRFDESRQCLLPPVGEDFPDVYDDPNAVTVTFTAGYGAEDGCMPRLIKAGIMASAGKMFFDPAQESSALHASEAMYDNIVSNLRIGFYP